MKLQNQNIYAILVFSAAFLLFSVQLIIGKYILPWYGGSPSVWITALLVFQLLLLVGYLFAHMLSKARGLYQLLLYFIPLAIAIAFLPIMPNPVWQSSNDNLVLGIILLLITTLGLPFIILSTASPLLQTWFTKNEGAHTPYRLYAWSNAGSLLGLLSYPVIIEPFLTVTQQIYVWSALFLIFGCTVIWLGLKTRNKHTATTSPGEENDIEKSHLSHRMLWLTLSCAASVLLFAITNFITQDVASIPLLWILPLIMYLLSFVITFSSNSLYDRRFFAPLFILVSLIGVFLITLEGKLPITFLIIAALLILFIFTIVCHGEVYALRPNPRHLTSFYLWIATGGALGGVFVAVISPLILPMYFEFHIALAVTLLILIVFWIRKKRWTPLPKKPGLSWAVIVSAPIIVIGILSFDVWVLLKEPTYVSRDFFGVIRVFDFPSHRELYHGRTLHGIQSLLEHNKCKPTTYYGHDSGLGEAAAFLQKERGLKIGVVGLGVGTSVIYGDYVRFYELNPEIARVAETQFTYLSECSKETALVFGDARLSMEREEPQQYDLIVLDAFSSDAIPVHLLTKEAFEVYLKHLKPDGIIAVHISNRYVDLKPVIGGIAKQFELGGAVHGFGGHKNEGTTSSTWGLLSFRKNFFEDLLTRNVINPDSMFFPRRVLWTDKYSNLLTLMRFQ